MSTTVGKMWDAAEQALRVDGVKMANPVTGLFDVMAYVEFADMDGLGKIIEEIQLIEGVRKTQTAIVMTPKIEE
jgi:DNA-binding Lrp family transcriptional regulator